MQLKQGRIDCEIGVVKGTGSPSADNAIMIVAESYPILEEGKPPRFDDSLLNHVRTKFHSAASDATYESDRGSLLLEATKRNPGGKGRALTGSTYGIIHLSFDYNFRARVSPFPCIKIEHVAVRPDMRRMGLGADLVQSGIRTMNDRFRTYRNQQNFGDLYAYGLIPPSFALADFFSACGFKTKTKAKAQAIAGQQVHFLPPAR